MIFLHIFSILPFFLQFVNFHGKKFLDFKKDKKQKFLKRKQSTPKNFVLEYKKIKTSIF
jgi:aminopeptidase C